METTQPSKRMSVGVVIGRFQSPEPHVAHIKLFQQVFIDGHKLLCVCLGVSPLDVRLPENPLSYAQREYLIHSFTPSPKYTMTIPLFDHKDDVVWSKRLDDTLVHLFPSADIVLYGGRDSFVSHYHGKLPVKTVEEYAGISATEIRKGIREETSFDFIRGQIYGINAAFPKVHPTVDVAVLDNHGQDVLLIRRADTGTWALPGGFVDPTDESFQFAAAREIYEELGLPIVPADLQYISNRRIPDWRYRSSRDKVFTTLFAFHAELFPSNILHRVKMNTEEVTEVCLCSLEGAYDRVDLHKPLIQDLIDRKARV